MRTICLELTFDGTQYCGWQKQPKDRTIQGDLNQALSEITNEEVRTIGCGRTDTGVHARRYVASFVLHHATRDIETIQTGVNAKLSKDVRVTGIKEMPSNFHALRNVKSKKYRYLFTHHEMPNVFLNRYVWQIKQSFDLKLMEQASKMLLGEHDFICFATHGVTTNTTVRTIEEITFGQMYDSVNYMEIKASGFLRHMVRVIMGTLMEVGQGKKAPSSLSDIIASKQRSNAGITAPAHGLFLWDVFYEVETESQTT